MTPEELAIAAHFERKLSEACMRVVLESSQDRDFFMGWVHRERLDVRSFARTRAASIGRAPVRDGRLAFVAGGRPVREKGFVELCRQFAQVRAWAAGRGLEATLSILCRERNRAKGADYIAEMEAAIAAGGLGKERSPSSPRFRSTSCGAASARPPRSSSRRSTIPTASCPPTRSR